MDSASLSTAPATELKLATDGESQACLFGSPRDRVYIYIYVMCIPLYMREKGTHSTAQLRELSSCTPLSAQLPDPGAVHVPSSPPPGEACSYCLQHVYFTLLCTLCK